MFTVKINNLPGTEIEKYTVARYVDGEWWFWGSYKDEQKAKEVSEIINGAVFEWVD